ncbi:MAG: methyltransferase domain-containing protein [Phycisphaerales bacterium]|nr:MAG: methyltransferase domain-containing protein [Phycisphaerales bacterium]
MTMNEKLDQHPLLEWREGKPFFRGLPVERRTICVAGRTFEIAQVKEAADLLNDPEFAKKFVEEDIAPYGVELWPAATMLARHILTEECSPTGEAIELGTGLGLVSIAAAAKGWQVVATDHDPTSLRFAEYNAGINCAHIARFELTDWNNVGDSRSFHRVFAADVLYQLVDHTPILRCIDTLLAPDGSAIIADPNRGVADRFPAMAEEAGFTVDEIPTHAPNALGEEVNGRIFIMRRRTD